MKIDRISHRISLTPHFAEQETKEQAVVGTQEDVGLEQTSCSVDDAQGQKSVSRAT
jgi:hypothetical protein